MDGADTDSLLIVSAAVEDAGIYQCIVQNPLVPGLDIVSDTITVVVKVPEGIYDQTKGFRVNGNPVDNLLSIDSDNMVEQVIIMDLTGKMVRNEIVNTNTIRMEVSELNKGVYFVTLRSASQDQVVKIIKQ